MYRKSIVRNIVLIIMVLLFSFASITLDANALTHKYGYVDNDTNVSGYSNNSSMSTHCDNWGTYLYSGNNGDSRYRQSTTKACYEWVWGKSIYTSSSITWKAKVYLNNYSFTDSNAHYTIMKDSMDLISFCHFYINQNTAPSGYSVFSGTNYSPTISGGVFRPWYGYVQNSGLSGVGTGADTFYYEFSY